MAIICQEWSPRTTLAQVLWKLKLIVSLGPEHLVFGMLTWLAQLEFRVLLGSAQPAQPAYKVFKEQLALSVPQALLAQLA